MMKFSLKTVACLVFVFILGVDFCCASFVTIEDFENLTLGNISGQNGWVAGSSTVVAIDPADTENQVLKVTAASTLVRKNMLLAQGDAKMMFLRFRFDKQLSASFGLSHLSNPDEYSDFGPELNLTNASTDLRIANSDTLGVYDTIADLQIGSWYNVWVMVDNLNDESGVWLNSSGDASSSDRLTNDQAGDLFGFRSSGTSDLINFYMKTSSGGSGDFGALYIDDIYIENTSEQNLTNPVPEPASLLILTIGGLLLRRKR
jgi:hypothetical protein